MSPSLVRGSFASRHRLGVLTAVRSHSGSDPAAAFAAAASRRHPPRVRAFLPESRQRCFAPGSFSPQKISQPDWEPPSRARCSTCPHRENHMAATPRLSAKLLRVVRCRPSRVPTHRPPPSHRSSIRNRLGLFCGGVTSTQYLEHDCKGCPLPKRERVGGVDADDGSGVGRLSPRDDHRPRRRLPRRGPRVLRLAG